MIFSLFFIQVDFFWINRDQKSFEWFVKLLSQLEIEQSEQDGVMGHFLDMHMYITSALQKTDMKAVGLQLALDLLHEKVCKLHRGQNLFLMLQLIFLSKFYLMMSFRNLFHYIFITFRVFFKKNRDIHHMRNQNSLSCDFRKRFYPNMHPVTNHY